MASKNKIVTRVMVESEAAVIAAGRAMLHFSQNRQVLGEVYSLTAKALAEKADATADGLHVGLAAERCEAIQHVARACGAVAACQLAKDCFDTGLPRPQLEQVQNEAKDRCRMDNSVVALDVLLVRAKEGAEQAYSAFVDVITGITPVSEI